MTIVTRIDTPKTSEFLKEFVIPRRPVIVRNLAPWKALDTWSIDSFRDRFGDRTITLSNGQKNMGAFLSEVESSSSDNPSEYLNQVPIAQEFPELLADLEPIPSIMKPNWLFNSLIPRRWGTFDGFLELFIGGAGSGLTTLHCDTNWVNTMITQVVGAKEFTIFAPSDTPYLYPETARPNISTVGLIDQVPPEEFPLFEKAKPIVVTVQPGETIYVPWGWWHATRILEPSIAVAASTANESNWSEFAKDFSKTGGLARRTFRRSLLKVVSSIESRKAVDG